jgi:hypothetical protein
MGKTRKALLCAAILLMLVSLPGCITATYETTINMDGSGKSKQDLAIDESFAGFVDSSQALSGKKGLDDAIKENMPKNGKYKKFTSEGKVHHQITFSFKDVEELNKVNKNLKKISSVPTPVHAKLERLDLLVFGTYTFTNRFPKSQGSGGNSKEEQAAKASSITYKLTLPGQIVDANTKEIKEDTATWQINADNGGKIEATSQFIRWWLVIVLTVFLLLIIAASIFGFFIAYRKFKTSVSLNPPASQDRRPDL